MSKATITTTVTETDAAGVTTTVTTTSSVAAVGGSDQCSGSPAVVEPGYVKPAPNHVMFDSPNVTYTPFIPGGVVQGTVAPGWERVRDAFEQNFAEGLEKGAQLVVRIDGNTVVDLHG